MSKKKKLEHLMILGITAGIVLSNSHLYADSTTAKVPDLMSLAKETDGNITYHLMTADELELELNDEGLKQFHSLSPEGQKLALELASRSCNGNNSCKHQNACRSKTNECAGQGNCKGQTICAFSDKNYAVKIAAKVMEERRQELQGKEAKPAATEATKK